MNEDIVRKVVPYEDGETDWKKVFGLAELYIELLKGDRCELRSIRATLLVNFGDTKHNRYGFTIKDEGSTHTMMMDVLRGLAGIKEI